MTLAQASVGRPGTSLAGFISRTLEGRDYVVDTVRAYCAPLREASVDTVVLGCTHYPLVRPMLQRMLGRGVRMYAFVNLYGCTIVSGDPLAHQVEHVLGARGLAHPRTDRAGREGRAAATAPAEGAEGRYEFLTTGDLEAFRALGTRFLQLPLGHVERVRLGAPEELVA